MKINNQEGYVLATVTILSAMVFLVGSSAIYMTSIGSQTLSSEAQYNKAKHAAEFGLNTAVNYVIVNTAKCGNTPSGIKFPPAPGATPMPVPGSTGSLRPTYNYQTVPDANGDNCFIYSIGKYGEASVIKTVIIPFKVIPNEGSAMRAGSITAVDFNGSNVAIGNTCNGAGVTTASVANPTELAELTAGSFGTPPVVVDPNLPDVYTSTFGPTISSHALMQTFIDTTVATKLLDISIPSACKVDPPITTTNTVCTTTSSQVSCSGTGYSKTVPLTGGSACTQVVIKAQNVTISSNMPTTTEFTINATNNLDINANIKGLLTSDGNLNLSPGNGTVEGIMIGNSAGTVDISGNPEIKGLFFVGNAAHNATVSALMSGNTSVMGALVVDGTLTNIRRNGGGNAGPGTYNIEYTPTILNSWGAKYPGLLKEASCGPGSPPVMANLSKTKMIMF